MANQRNQNQRRSSRDPAPRSRRPQQRARQRHAQQQRSRRRTASRSGLDLSRLLALRPKADFKPDAQDSGLLKMLHLTQVQRDVLLTWGL